MAATMVSSRTVLPAHQGRIGLALNHSLDKFAHPLAYPSFDRIEPVVEQINRCVGGGGPTATFSGISAVGREGEARWLATADGERPRLSQGCASQPKLLVGRHGARGRRAT